MKTAESGSTMTPAVRAGMRLAMAMFIVATATATPRAASAQEAIPVAQAPDREPLRPGDIIRLRVWREPDFSGDFPVEANGAVVLPRMGSVDIRSETGESLRQRLVANFSEVLTQPAISVTVLRRIQVLGAVNKPGLYPVDATMSVSDAIALAGGATSNAKADAVVLVRDGQRLRTNLSSSASLTSSSIQSGDQIYVPERSRFTSDPRLIAGILTATVSIAIALIRR
jgi:protein involved in polysaccharide export with SLBB domain